MLIAACLLVHSPLAAGAENPPPADDAQESPSQAEIDAWIAQLDSNEYVVRETATKHLQSAAAFALDRLLEAANGDRPEPAERAVWILQGLVESPDLALRERALERLVQLRERPAVVAQAELALAEIRQQRARTEVIRFGGKFLSPGKSQRYQGGGNVVELTETWQGGDDGLRHLLEVRGVPVVVLAHADVTFEGIAQLADMPGLMVLYIGGVQLEADQLARLRTTMPHVQIEYKRGALLGVKGDPTAPDARITEVRPNTAASRADLRTGDVIRKLNGQPIANFVELTEAVAQLPAGAEGTLEIDRDGTTLTKQVKFGQL